MALKGLGTFVSNVAGKAKRYIKTDREIAKANKRATTVNPSKDVDILDAGEMESRKIPNTEPNLKNNPVKVRENPKGVDELNIGGRVSSSLGYVGKATGETGEIIANNGESAGEIINRIITSKPAKVGGIIGLTGLGISGLGTGISILDHLNNDNETNLIPKPTPTPNPGPKEEDKNPYTPTPQITIPDWVKDLFGGNGNGNNGNPNLWYIDTSSEGSGGDPGEAGSSTVNIENASEILPYIFLGLAGIAVLTYVSKNKKGQKVAKNTKRGSTA